MKNFFIQIIIFLSSFYFSYFKKNFTEIPKNLSSNIIEDIKSLLFLLPEDKTISFNNSLINVTLYNTSDASFSYEKMNINFENCLTILQKVYDLDPFFDYSNNNTNEIYKRCFFIIIKIEINRKLVLDNTSFFYKKNISLEYALNSGNSNNYYKNNSIAKRPTNHIEFLIFNGKKGNLLDTSYCNDLNVKILHPIIEKNMVDLNSSKNFYEKFNIDVFKTNDSFFNNICTNFTSDQKKDMTLNQRRNQYYQNVSFCDANCTYIEINYTSNTAVCACEIKDGVMNEEILLELQGENENGFSYDDVISVINYKLFKCYKEVFDFKRLLINAGNYFSLLYIIIYTICVIHFYKNRKRNVMRYFQIMKEKYINEKKKQENIDIEQNKEQQSEQENSESNNKSNSDKINNKCISNNSGEIEDKKEENESNNKSVFNIADVTFGDISNPPLKKKKMRLKINPENNDKSLEKDKNWKPKNIKLILNSNNSVTKDTFNYGEMKIDTHDELIETKNNYNNINHGLNNIDNIDNDNDENENIEKDWNEIITLKKIKYNNNNERYITGSRTNNSNSYLSSTKNTNTKKSTNSSNTDKVVNEYTDNDYIFPSKYSLEIPISNIVPSFMKSKNQNLQNIIDYSRNKKNSFVNSISKDLTSSQNTFIFRRNKTKTNNSIYNNYIINQDQDIISEKKENENNCISDYNKKDKNKNNNNFIKKNKNKNNNIINNIGRSSLRRTKEIEHKKEIKNNKIQKKKNFIGEFDEMKFEIAILTDNRNFCQKLVCELKEKCIIILLFYEKDLMFKQLELSLFILSCTLDYFFNAFLYSEVYLQEEYEQEQIIKLFIDYPKEILSSLASQFIVKLIELLMEERAITLFIKKMVVEEKEYLKGINFLLRKYQRRLYIYIIIGYILLLITWYFTCAFCTVYQNSQFNLLYDTLESLGINLLIPLPLSFISIVFRHLAILKLNKFLFFISNIFRIFA